MSGATRFAWLDLYRGSAVLAMIETHVVNTWLALPLRETSWFWWLNYFNGLIAPSFLFIAGYAQGMAMRRTPAPAPDWGKRFRRLGTIALVGYMLHFPGPLIFAGRWEEAIRIGTQVDVLQCIAASLAVLLALGAFGLRVAEIGAITLAVLAVGAEVWMKPVTSLPVPLLAWCNKSTDSLFPLAPWFAFAAMGFVASRKTNLWLEGAILAVLAFFVPGTPGFFIQRLAWVVVAIPVAVWIGKSCPLPRGVLFAGKQSLVMYVVHLLLIESALGLGVSRSAHSVPTCLGLFVAVLAATFSVTFAWAKWRQRMVPHRGGMS